MSAHSEAALLWDAVLGDTAWTDVLRAISATTSGSATCLLQARSDLSFDFWFHEFDPGEPDLLGGLMDPARNPIAAAMHRAPVGVPFDRRQAVSDAIYDSEPPFDYFRRQDIFHGIICKLAGASTTEAAFWVGMPKDSGDECARIAPRFSAWAPLLQRALRARTLLDYAAETEKIYSDALGERAVGVVTVDLDLRIRSCNARAEQILAAEDGIGRRRGVLVVASPGAQRRLRGEAHLLGQARPNRDSAPIRVPRPSGRPDYSVEVLPARRAGVAATLLITDPAERALPDAERLIQRFGFTNGEARAARLATLALSKAQIADRLGLSENTVKSQLAAARNKIGARNALELVTIIQRA